MVAEDHMSEEIERLHRHFGHLSRKIDTLSREKVELLEALRQCDTALRQTQCLLGASSVKYREPVTHVTVQIAQALVAAHNILGRVTEPELQEGS